MSRDETSTPPTQVWDPRVGRWVAAHELVPIFPRDGAHTAGDGRRAGWPVWAAAISGGLIGAAVALAVVFAVADPSSNGTAIERRIDPGVAATDGGEGRIVEIAARARPWVVNIDTTGRRQSAFGTRVTQGTGSGVLVRSDGHIITNAHVLEGADSVEVTLASGDTVEGRIVGSDPDSDVGVVKIDRSDLPSAVIGSAKDLHVGETVVAIGSPLGLQQSVTAGIVSALGRTVDRLAQGLPALTDMVQTDAAVTSGNSGGALIDADGALVGINTAIAASPDVGAEGIAFAIPIDIAKAVADQLIQTGRVTHPWIGIQGGNIDAETARQFGIGQGALVLSVVPDSPAAAAGLQEGDVIIGFDGETITSMDELIVEIRGHEVGEVVPVEVVRDGEAQTLEIEIGERPDDL